MKYNNEHPICFIQYDMKIVTALYEVMGTVLSIS